MERSDEPLKPRMALALAEILYNFSQSKAVLPDRLHFNVLEGKRKELIGIAFIDDKFEEVLRC